MFLKMFESEQESDGRKFPIIWNLSARITQSLEAAEKNLSLKFPPTAEDFITETAVRDLLLQGQCTWRISG